MLNSQHSRNHNYVESKTTDIVLEGSRLRENKAIHSETSKTRNGGVGGAQNRKNSNDDLELDLMYNYSKEGPLVDHTTGGADGATASIANKIKIGPDE